MCRGCEVDSGPGRGEIWANATQDEKAFERNSQSVTMTRILGAYGITIRELSAGDTYLLSNRTGGSTVVAGIHHVWASAAKLAGTEINVLDNQILLSLEQSPLR